MSKQEVRAELRRRMDDPGFVLYASTKAMRAAVLEHKRVGNPVATWRDGKVIIVQPADISIEEAGTSVYTDLLKK